MEFGGRCFKIEFSFMASCLRGYILGSVLLSTDFTDLHRFSGRIVLLSVIICVICGLFFNGLFFNRITGFFRINRIGVNHDNPEKSCNPVKK
jgi:hypothetical protein